MNLIDQLGGYERAKQILQGCAIYGRPDVRVPVAGGFIHIVADFLEQDLLRYRRANNIFELNDWVLTNNQDFSEEPCQLVEDYNYDFKYKTKSGHWGFIVKSFLPTKWRHATDDEIEAGKRLGVAA